MIVNAMTQTSDFFDHRFPSFSGRTPVGAKVMPKQWGTTKMEHGTLLRMQCIAFEDTKDPVYKTIVQRMMATYEAQGCKMSLKVHFLHSHIDSFPENLGAYSEEQVERFHQEFCDIDR
ncbi:hypothetical protein AVEN_123600-1 [Araneus ventricosus]|uniref:Uncharacterized protein n=1 Tax=Araneus ventricosus TaxID=182803 RepID=A0A4Y2TK30_ARAVE|nr:hypothetical protein AVEN_123600-1 [Araneus ventricosus]